MVDLSTVTIVLIVVSGLLVGMATVYTDFSVNYGVSGNTTNETTLLIYNRTRELNTTLYDMQTHAMGAATSAGNLNIWTGLQDVSALFLSLHSLLLKSFGIFDAMIKDFANIMQFPLPPWFSAMITGVMATVFIYGIIKLIFRVSSI